MTRILGIAGSLRRESFNKAVLRAAQKLVPQGATLESIELDGIPLFNQDDEKSPPAKVVELKRRIREADAILIVTPEYNYSVPGVLKNAIDWASRAPEQPFDGKPVAIMGASPGMLGTARAQYHLRQCFLRQCFVFLNGLVLNRPEVMIANAAQRFDEQGRLTDAKTREFVAGLLVALRDWTERLRR